MAKFTDTIDITVRSGKGGPGCVSFHREKYIAKGGPDGGDGGRGGDLYLEADRRYYNLAHLFKDRIYKAQNGQPGMGANMHGKDGVDLTIKVPVGTQVRDAETDELIADLMEEKQRVCVCTGGIGGKGNAFFKSSTNQVPRFAQPGTPATELTLNLNLKLIADIGLVGLPNAGKSTLLSKITNAKPKIANYPFTTLIPNLGVVTRKDGRIFTIADIPGIIEGAHKGHGLGLSFLQHIERVKVLLYLIDITEDNINYNLELLKSELATYNEKLPDKPYYIVLTKTDEIDNDDQIIADKLSELTDHKTICISSVEGYNLDTLLDEIDTLLETANA